MIRDDFPFSDTPAPEVLVSESEKLVDGHVWDIRRERFEFGGDILEREYMDHTGAVAVLALDDEDRVLLFQQYRHPIGHRDWEIPAGLMDISGESGLATAVRELAEEADLTAEHWSLLLDLFLSPGGSSEVVRVFVARGLSEATHEFVRAGEEAELEPVWVPLDAAVAAVLDGRIANGLAASALLAAAASKAGGWATLRDPRTPWTARDLVRGERSK